ncbi:MAG: peptidylprolyl isomerase [bacterium]|nr:peptidylprolyl isomerase [bacterium]
MEMKASHILVKDRSLANMLLRKVKSGGNFAAMAKEHSICGSKSKGGDLGWFPPEKMVPKFSEACKKLKVGRISGLVSTQFGFHIIKKTGER